MLADLVDAVIGGDTHRDTHTLEMTSPTGATISVCTVANTAAGFADALSWIEAHAPGRRLIVGLEGTRSYGIGLARAAAAAGLMVVEVERPRRAERRRGKSDPKDARLAALSVLQMQPDKLPIPRADGDREALRILLTARRDLTVARTAQINRLRALLLSGDEADRALAKGRLSDQWLGHIARRRGRAGATREQAIRLGEARRLADPGEHPRPATAGQDRRWAGQRSTNTGVVLPSRSLPQRRGVRRSGRR
jgi:transposase